MLAKNLTDLRKEKKLTQLTVANAVGISRSTYADYEKGKSEPGASVLIKLATYFNVKADELVSGLVPLPLFRQPRQTPRLLDDVRVLPITVDSQQRENIQYVPHAAVAGYLSEHNQPEFIGRLPHFRLPKLTKGSYRAFDIQGDSMPPLHNGYVLIGRFVEHERDLKSGNRYVLVVKNQGIVFKKVIRTEKKSGRETGSPLILVSDNPEFLPYTVDLADVLEAWEMVSFIGYPDVYQDATHLLNDRLQVIEQKLNQLATPD
ncbi:XRE family transcriptional regulator [Larkinella rosea]|uniref:LexA family transcriptional regulator n=1 Tax=Larkinella rosea TaxID=2025312 RepID=A0A3P1BSE3_9BACT|nr:LexA family transcriptional regulator [Larkinella rosea]RRB04020.1 LexA family transcriptional regulator [Larkinella rosea]